MRCHYLRRDWCLLWSLGWRPEVTSFYLLFILRVILLFFTLVVELKATNYLIWWHATFSICLIDSLCLGLAHYDFLFMHGFKLNDFLFIHGFKLNSDDSSGCWLGPYDCCSLWLDGLALEKRLFASLRDNLGWRLDYQPERLSKHLCKCYEAAAHPS